MSEIENEITNQIQPQPISSKEKVVKVIPIILGFLIAIGLFLNAYLLLKKNNRSFPIGFPVNLPTPIIPSPTSAPDATANWKTYRDDKYEIEFKYPPGWKVELAGDEGGDEYPVISDENNDENNFVVHKLCHSNCLSFSDPKNEYKISEVKINSITWIKREHPTWEEFMITSYPNLNCCLRFIASPVGQKNGILDQILSTFKFTDNQNTINTPGKENNFSGFLRKTTTILAPDISYDYEMVFDEPLTGISTGLGDNQTIEKIVVNNNPKLNLAQYVDKHINFIATLEWGYDESKYLNIVKILP